MKKMLVAGAAVAAAVSASPALAAPAVYFIPGSYGNAAYPFPTTQAVFETFETPADVNGQQFVARTGPVAAESKAGNVSVQAGNIPNLTADPDPANIGGTQYLSIGANGIGGAGSYTVNFVSPVQLFSFILGSLDTYNNLLLTFTGGGTQNYAGGQIIGNATVGAIPGVNGNGNSTVAGRAFFDAQGGPGITSATFSSQFAAFEIDALAAAVPEPGTWGMMILGVGLMGAQLRTRRRKVTFSAA